MGSNMGQIDPSAEGTTLKKLSLIGVKAHSQVFCRVLNTSVTIIHDESRMIFHQLFDCSKINSGPQRGNSLTYSMLITKLSLI